MGYRWNGFRPFWGTGQILKGKGSICHFLLMCMKEENDCFEQNAPQIFWKLDQPGGRMLFPKGENWCVFQVMGSEGLVVRGAFYGDPWAESRKDSGWVHAVF